MIGSSYSQCAGREATDTFYVKMSPDEYISDRPNGTTPRPLTARAYNTSDGIENLTYEWSSDNPAIVLGDFVDEGYEDVIYCTVSGFNEFVSGTVSCVITDTVLMQESIATCVFEVTFS